MTTVWFLKNYFDIDFTDYGVSSYDIGIGFGHFAISTPDVYKLVEDIRAKGGVVTREPGPVKGGQSVITFVKDDGYVFELIQRGPTLEPLRQVMLRVGDLETAGTIYFKRIFAHGCMVDFTFDIEIHVGGCFVEDPTLEYVDVEPLAVEHPDGRGVANDGVDDDVGGVGGNGRVDEIDVESDYDEVVLKEEEDDENVEDVKAYNLAYGHSRIVECNHPLFRVWLAALISR
nr:putative lactoylglutathione lyase [Quercus suber]